MFMADIGDFPRLKWVSHLVLIPLQFYATLQRLDLIPAWPLLPWPFGPSYLQPLLPILPVYQSKVSLIEYTRYLASCPLTSFLCMIWFTEKVKPRIGQYARAVLPRPDNPDVPSFYSTYDEEVSITAPVLEYPRFQGSLRQEVEKDMHHITGLYLTIRSAVRNFVRNTFGQRRSGVEFPDPIETEFKPHVSYRQAQQDHSTSSLLGHPSSETPQSTADHIAPSGTELSSTITSASPPATPTSSEDPGSPVSEPSNVRIRTRTGSTSTLHMDVEFESPERGAPVLTSSFAASPRPAIIETSITQLVSGRINLSPPLRTADADFCGKSLTTE